MRWIGSGKVKVDDCTVFYSGTDGIHEHGVKAIISPDIAKWIRNFVPITERAMLPQINASQLKSTPDKPEDRGYKVL